MTLRLYAMGAVNKKIIRDIALFYYQSDLGISTKNTNM